MLSVRRQGSQGRKSVTSRSQLVLISLTCVRDAFFFCSVTPCAIPSGMMMRHDRLLNLALKAVGDFISDICLQLVTLPHDEASLLCDQLQDLLHSMIPYTLANEATDKLLACINNLSTRIPQWNREPWREEIFERLISAVIHPAVTVIKLSSWPEHIFPFGIKGHFLVPSVYNQLKNLSKLKVLRLERSQCENWVVERISVSQTLEEFTFNHSCNDQVLGQLAKVCKRLRCLNVWDSKRVSDGSLSAILQFEHLEQLNIAGTHVSELGLTRLLHGLAEHSKQLRSFGCSYITYTQLNFLVQNFPNLIEIQFSHCGVFDLSPLGALRGLRILRFHSLKFGQMQALLQDVGPQLTVLELRHIQSMDIKFIGEHCTALRCLHLFSHGVLQPCMDGINRDSLPGLQGVQCLEFDCDWRREWINTILSQCFNVRRVQVSTQHRDTYLLLKHVLFSNPLKALELLNWSPTSPDGENIAKQLAEQCPNLTEVKGLSKHKMNYRGVHIH